MSFFTTVKGNYRIELAGGSAPHGGDPTATVELESEEVVLTLPYCFPSGACDPGYVMIPFGRVNVVQDGLTFLISVTDGTTRYRYSWRWQTPDTVIFRNYQYRVDASTVITMEHVLKRKEIPFEAY